MGLRLFRIYTAGEADAGKSTLLGRLLLDAGGLTDDQLDQIRDENGEPLLHLVTDGLQDEQTNSMTIDTAYRHLRLASGARCLFADTPGQHDLIQNSISGASTADLVLLTAPADRPVGAEALLHLHAAAWLGVPAIVLCVTKMDSCGYSEAAFNSIAGRFEQAAAEIGFSIKAAVPAAALSGENILRRAASMPWYTGPAIAEVIAAEIQEFSLTETDLSAARFLIQTSFTDSSGGNFIAGCLAEGRIRAGSVLCSSSGDRIEVGEILRSGRPSPSAGPGDSIALRLPDQPACPTFRRGALLYPPEDKPISKNRFKASICWLSSAPLNGQSVFIARHGTAYTPVQIEKIFSAADHRGNPGDTGQSLAIGDFGEVEISAFEPFQYNPALLPGRVAPSQRFILIHPLTFETIAAGKIVG